jgi:hypothetical protein
VSTVRLEIDVPDETDAAALALRMTDELSSDALQVRFGYGEVRVAILGLADVPG